MLNKISYFALPVALVGISLVTGCNGVKNRIAEMKTEIKVQLPLGSSERDVIAYLNKNHIEHTDYVDAGSDQETLKLNGAPGRVNGIIRHVSSGLFYRSDIRLSFWFDKNGKLSSYDVVEAVTSL
jgi:hypothetical protein